MPTTPDFENRKRKGETQPFRKRGVKHYLPYSLEYIKEKSMPTEVIFKLQNVMIQRLSYTKWKRAKTKQQMY